MEKTFFNILLVEDNPADSLLLRELFKGIATGHRISVVKHGAEALGFLRKSGRYVGCVRPDIILLDLNLPVMDGRECLKEIKADTELKEIPVIVLTTSASDEDVKSCYSNHANCYLTKPIELDGYRKLVESIELFWLRTARLPPKAQTEIDSHFEAS